MPNIPQVIRNLRGVNRHDSPELVADNEFNTLQNWYHRKDGYLQKRFGSVGDLGASDRTGIGRINGLSRLLDQDRKRYTLYHCQPDSSALPDPSAAMVLTPVSDALSRMNPGPGSVDFYVCYTFVGLGTESAWNSAIRSSGLPASNGSHQTVSISPTERLDITVPAFPAGVRAINVFIARDTATYFTLAGTVTTSGGTLSVRSFIAPTAAAKDTVPNIDVTSGISITVRDSTTPGGNLRQRKSGYFISFAWMTDPGASFSLKFTKLSNAVTAIVNEDNSSIEVSASSIASASANGGESLYVFIGFRGEQDHPMMLAGVININDPINTLVINDVPTNHNASSHPLNIMDRPTTPRSGTVTVARGSTSVVGTGSFFLSEFDVGRPIGIRGEFFLVKSITDDENLELSWQSERGHTTSTYEGSAIGPVNTTEGFFNQAVFEATGPVILRPSFLLAKDEEGTVREIQPSRLLRQILYMDTAEDLVMDPFKLKIDSLNIPNMYRQVHFFVEKEAFGGDFPYRDPTFEFFQGLVYFNNGRDVPWETDGYSLGSLTEEYCTILPPVSDLLAVFQSSLVQLGTRQASNQVFASNATNPRNWMEAAVTTSLRFFSIGDAAGGDPITAVGKFAFTTGSDGPTSFVLACKKSEVWRIGNLPDSGAINPQLDQVSGRVGCVASSSMVLTPAGLQFLGGDGEIYRMRGTGEPQPTGTKVLPILEHLGEDDDTARKSTAVYHDQHYKLSYPSSLPSTLTGTVTGSVSSNTLTGTGTAFTTELSVGDYIRVGNATFRVETITNDTSLDIDLALTLGNDFTNESFSTAPNNNAQLWNHLSAGPRVIGAWSGPHTGIQVGPQIILKAANENNQRLGGQNNGSNSLSLDDVSSVQDLGTNIESIIESKEYRFRAEFIFKRVMGMGLDCFFDYAFSHDIKLQGYADSDSQTINKTLSTAGGVWDTDSWDAATFGGSGFFPVMLRYGSTNLVGRTYRYKITHSNPAQFIIAVIGTVLRPEKRIIV